jgi:uracil-DNA glycosylase
MGDHPSVALFEKSAMVKPYPPSVLEVPHQLPSTAFFPGGYGLWLGNSLCGPMELPPFPFEGIMAVGQDFHSEKQYDQTRMHPGQNLTKGMWPRFKDVYDRAGADFQNTFFTNAYMGLRKGEKSTGVFPGATDQSFVKRCQSFFGEQVETQKPKLILALGKRVVPFMADLSVDLHCWKGKTTIKEIQNGKQIIEGVRFGLKGHQCVVAFLLHPSMRNSNLRHRQYQEFDRDQADIQVFKDALKAAGL